MSSLPPIKVTALIFLLLMGALLAWLTTSEQTADPCANTQGDVSGAVLAEGDGDQDALVNRAIIVRAACKKAEKAKSQPQKPQ